MSGAFLWLLADTSVRALGIAIVGGLVALRVRNAAIRHAIWIAVLGSMLLMPVVSTVLPPLRLPIPANGPLRSPWFQTSHPR